MTGFFWALFTVGAILQLLVIASLLKGQHYKRFPFLFLYLIVLFLTGVADASAFLEIGVWTDVSRRYFWLNDAIRQSLMFTVVISLVFEALRQSPLAWLRGWLLSGAAIFAVLSVVLTSMPNLDTWMTTIVRNLSFCAVVLNVALWLALARNRLRDRLLLLVSGGLGLQMAGEAIGHSVRQMAIAAGSRMFVRLGNVVLILAHLLCLYVWLRAFQKSDVKLEIEKGHRAVP